MSVKVRRISEARHEGNGERRYAPTAAGEGDFEREDDGGRRFAGGVVVTRRTDDSGNPIAYQLTSSDTA